MSIGLLILASVGLSVDVFLAVAGQGAKMAQIKKKEVAMISLVFMGWQAVALLMGVLLSHLPFFRIGRHPQTDAWEVIAAVVFLGIGIRFGVKAILPKKFLERRAQVEFRKINLLAMLTGIDVFLAGVAFGVMGTGAFTELLILEIVTLVCSVGGLFYGYRMGLWLSPKVNASAAAALILTGVLMMIRLS